MQNETNINSNIEVIDVMKMPDVLNTRLSEEDESIIAKEVTQCTEKAIDNFISMRENEGEKIKEDLINRISSISEKIDKINAISTGLVERIYSKIREEDK